MASLVPLKNRIKYLDLYEALETTLKLFSLTCVSVCGTAVDDTLATIVKEKKEGLIKLMKDYAIAVDNSCLMKYH